MQGRRSVRSPRTRDQHSGNFVRSWIGLIYRHFFVRRNKWQAKYHVTAWLVVPDVMIDYRGYPDGRDVVFEPLLTRD